MGGLKRILVALLANSDAPDNGESYIKTMISNALILMGMAWLSLFALLDLLVGSYAPALVRAPFIVAGIVLYFYFRRTNNYRVTSNVLMAMFFVLELVLFFKLGKRYTGMFWYYIFPLMSFFLLGHKLGLRYVLALLGITLVGLNIDLPQWISVYDTPVTQRFLASFITLAVVGYLAELSRYVTLQTLQQTKDKVERQKNELAAQANYLQESMMEAAQANTELEEQREELMVQRETLLDVQYKLQEQYKKEKEHTKEIEKQRDELQQQKAHIEWQANETMSSIRYAKTIQQAVQPKMEHISEHFDCFNLYLPKDIVSGDLVWMHYFPARGYQSAKFFVATIDCTGHGVPGAFLSMVAVRLLNEIVKELRIISPNDILEHLDRGVFSALNQGESDNDDGMDVCLCLIEKLPQRAQTIDKRTITFAGAKRPLIYYDHKTKQVKQLSGTRRSIGGTSIRRKTMPFVNTEMHMSSGDMLYLTTDGYIDQHGPDRKRFGRKRMLNLLEDIAPLAVQVQDRILRDELDKHQHSEDQRDDITILGLRL